jgi:preprotein translocase subunit SecG
MFLYYGLVTVYVLICMLLLVVVLLQQGKGGGIAAAFGGSSSQTAFGARTGATVLTRATTILGSLFLVGAFALTLMGRTGTGGSVVSGVDAPAPPAETPAPPVVPPATPAPPVETPPAPAPPKTP